MQEQQELLEACRLNGSAVKLLWRPVAAQKAFKDVRCPFLEPLIFCSTPGLQVELPQYARKRVCVRDREESEGREPRPGIIAALTRGQIEGIDPAYGTPPACRARVGQAPEHLPSLAAAQVRLSRICRFAAE
jgi:hypothetical protein